MTNRDQVAVWKGSIVQLPDSIVVPLKYSHDLLFLQRDQPNKFVDAAGDHQQRSSNFNNVCDSVLVYVLELMYQKVNVAVFFMVRVLIQKI